jgi:hypothetical protein
MQRKNGYSVPYFFSQCNYHLWGVKINRREIFVRFQSDFGLEILFKLK